MNAFVPRSIEQKLLAVVLLTTLAGLLVAIAAMIAYDLRLYHKSWVDDLSTQAELLGRTSAPALTFDDPRVATENLELLRFRPGVRAGALYDSRGRLFASYASDESRPFPELPEAEGARVEGNELVIFKRVANSREILGTVYLRGEYKLYEHMLGYLGIAGAVALAALLVAYLLSRPLRQAVTRPLLAIADVAREVTEKRNFALRAAKLSDDEVGRLAEAFNTMLGEIGHATAELEKSNHNLEHEVAERRRIEQEVLRLNEELERRVAERTAQLQYTNKELEAFCYTVSHDLRAPLRSIDGFGQALLEDFPKEIPEEGRRYLARMRSATARMGQLIEDLLNLSRVSRGELDRREVDVTAVASQVLAELQSREPGRNVELLVWDGMRATADARLVRTALENLIGNAWKFTSKTAGARIEVGRVPDGEEVTFFVRDNGAGFDMAYANKLFGAFQRLHSAEEYAGTGIGLATVQRIVHRHGGRVWVDASPGKGATFFFTLAASGVQGESKHAKTEGMHV